MANQTKKSVMAIVREVTEATPVAPTAGTNYLALQDGFDVSAAFDTLENAELTGSIGTAKAIQGFEAPTASLSHYIKHSGVEGQEPEMGLLLEAAFGAKAVNATEYVTLAASTVSTIKSTGAVTNFERGEALLIKDGVNGYSIRPVLSVSGTDITLGFQLPAASAPAVGVALGKAVLYKPGETHPTMSIWDYRANGAAVQLVAGARVTDFSMDAAAGELVSGSFSMEGVSFYYDPIEIKATDTKLDFNETGPTLRAATVAAKMYKDPNELAAALQTAMNDVASDAITVTYSNVTGKFTIASAGALLELLWNTGVNTANTIGDKIGFSTAADSTGALTYTSASAVVMAAPQTPAFDASNPLVAKDNLVLIGDATDAAPGCFSAQSISMTLSDTKADIKDICAESGKSGSLITQRQVTVDVVANLSVYDAQEFTRFRTNQTTSFMYCFGTKTGGNWEAGKSGCLYIPTATISAFKLGDADGLVTLEMTLTAFVASGLGEVYLNFV